MKRGHRRTSINITISYIQYVLGLRRKTASERLGEPVSDRSLAMKCFPEAPRKKESPYRTRRSPFRLDGQKALVRSKIIPGLSIMHGSQNLLNGLGLLGRELHETVPRSLLTCEGHTWQLLQSIQINRCTCDSAKGSQFSILQAPACLLDIRKI